MAHPLPGIVEIPVTSSQGCVREETSTTNEDDLDRRMLSMFDKYLNGELKHLEEDDETEDEIFDDESSDNMNESVNEFAANYFQSAREKRKSRSSTSTFGILNSSRSKSAREIVHLLRHFYEQERSETFINSFKETEIELPVDFDKLTQEEAVEHFKQLRDEVEQKNESHPKLMALNHEKDLKNLIEILRGHRKQVVESAAVETQEQANGDNQEDSELVQMTSQIIKRIQNIRALQKVASERLEDLKTLQSLGQTTNSNASLSQASSLNLSSFSK